MNLHDILRPVSRIALTAGLAGLIGLAAPAAVSFAQDAPSAEEGRRGHGERGERGRHGRRGHHGPRAMFAELDLSDAQRAQIRSIMQTARENRGEGHQPGARAAVHAQVEAVLTPAQRTQAAELRQAHHAERLEHRVTRMSEHLSLSDEQAGQVRGILRSEAMQRRALHEQAATDPSAREAMRGLRERTQASIRSVLSAEQAEQLDAAQARRAERRGERGNREGRRGRRGPRTAR